MSDSIKNDDEKFRELVVKQHPTFESFVESLRPTETDPENVIENDDNKMEDLLILQSLTEEAVEPEKRSLEEKYEEEIMIGEIAKAVNEDFRRLEDNDDPFGRFFIIDDEDGEGDAEQW